MLTAIVPARAGSKRILNKCMRLMNGHPLIHWTLLAAEKAHSVDKVILTSDSDEILEFAKKYPKIKTHKRLSALATDEASTTDVILDVLTSYSMSGDFVLLQPTSPLRTSLDIENAYSKFTADQNDFLVSVKPINVKSNLLLTINNERLQFLVPAQMGRRTQESNGVFAVNGALYFSKINAFLSKKTFFNESTSTFIMDAERSIDIDIEAEFLEAEACLAKVSHC